MKILIKLLLAVGVFMTTAGILHAQNLKPATINISYLGELATHPGLKVGLTYPVKSWEKSRINNKGKEKSILTAFEISPSAGVFYHRDYQTGIFVLPEMGFSRQNGKGNYKAVGIGVGYMRTQVPHVYEIHADGEIGKIHAGYNYFVTNYSLTFGKDLSIKRNIPVGIFIKPQVMYAVPNYNGGILYFALEAGLNYHL
ncbi:MAG: hypothetical protein R3D00_08880 [Bacteroidia bacterium]